MRLIDATRLVSDVLKERNKIPLTVVERYSFGVPSPFGHGQSMRGGIRKALRCIEQAPTIDAVPVVRCKDCENWERDWLCSSGNLKEHFCPMIGCVTDHEFYCKHGSRMDGDPDG